MSALHFVQLGRSVNDDIYLHARASLPIEGGYEALRASPNNLRACVRELLSRGPFQGRRAVVAMPAGLFRTMSVNYRTKPDQSEAQAISELMTERLDGPLHDYVLDYIPVRATARDAEKLAIVAVSRRDDVMALLSAFHRAGLRVEALEIAPVALRRLANTLSTKPSDMTLIINTGRHRSYMTLLSGRRLLLDQALEFGETGLIQALCDALELDFDQARDLVMRTGLHSGAAAPLDGHHEGETGIFNTLLEILRPQFLALVDQTDRAFMYAAAQTRGGGDARIILLGALARWPGCDRILSNLTHLPVSILPGGPDSFVAPDAPARHIPANRPEYAVASGLALRGLADDA